MKNKPLSLTEFAQAMQGGEPLPEWQRRILEEWEKNPEKVKGFWLWQNRRLPPIRIKFPKSKEL